MGEAKRRRESGDLAFKGDGYKQGQREAERKSRTAFVLKSDFRGRGRDFQGKDFEIGPDGSRRLVHDGLVRQLSEQHVLNASTSGGAVTS